MTGFDVLGPLHRRLFARTDRPVETVLVVRLDLLGDVLFSRQATQAIRNGYPEARIIMLTLPSTASVARAFDEVDEVITVDTNLIRRHRTLLDPATWRHYHAAARTLWERNIDLAVSLSGPMASFWAYLSGAPQVVGYEGEAYAGMLSDAVPGGRYKDRIHEVEYVRRLASAAGGVPAERRLAISVDSGAASRVEVLLRESGVTPDHRLVLIHAGAVNGSAKRWPASYWSSFADRLAGDGIRVALIGAESDRAIAQEVVRGTVSQPVNLAGHTTVDEMIALIARCAVLASGDSGPLHFAVALSRPAVSVYGPTDPSVHGPYHPTAPVAVHRADLPCSPCYGMEATAECPLGDPICMRLVPVERMVESALKLLAGEPS